MLLTRPPTDFSSFSIGLIVLKTGVFVPVSISKPVASITVIVLHFI